MATSIAIRPLRISAHLLVIGAAWLLGCVASVAQTWPVQATNVTPPLCNRFAHNGKLVCINIVEVAVRIPPGAVAPGLVRCVLYSQEQQVLGTGEAILSPPTGKLWVVLRPRHRSGLTTLHAETICTIQAPYVAIK